MKKRRQGLLEDHSLFTAFVKVLGGKKVRLTFKHFIKNKLKLNNTNSNNILPININIKNLKEFKIVNITKPFIFFNTEINKILLHLNKLEKNTKILVDHKTKFKKTKHVLLEVSNKQDIDNFHINHFFKIFNYLSEVPILDTFTNIKNKLSIKKTKNKFTKQKIEVNTEANINYYWIYKIWSLSLFTYNYNKINNLVYNPLQLKLKYSQKNPLLIKLINEFFWLDKYLTTNLTKQKVVLSWLLFLITKDSKYIVSIIFYLINKTNFKKHKYILLKIKRLLIFFLRFIKKPIFSKWGLLWNKR